MLPRDIELIGVPANSSGTAGGVGRAPGVLRERGLSAMSAGAILPAPWWLHVDLDVLATSEFAAVDYPQPGGLTWAQLTQITCAALKANGCAGWSVCIYNPDLDPDRIAADTIISYLTQAITTASGLQ
jgi:arginase